MAFIEIFCTAYVPFMMLIVYLGGRSAWSALRRFWDRQQHPSCPINNLGTPSIAQTPALAKQSSLTVAAQRAKPDLMWPRLPVRVELRVGTMTMIGDGAPISDSSSHFCFCAGFRQPAASARDRPSSRRPKTCA
jgi:hypothetical protein